MKYFELAPFDLHVTAEVVVEALREDKMMEDDR
jgi:hypothetical protein